MKSFQLISQIEETWGINIYVTFRSNLSMHYYVNTKVPNRYCLRENNNVNPNAAFKDYRIQRITINSELVNSVFLILVHEFRWYTNIFFPLPFNSLSNSNPDTNISHRLSQGKQLCRGLLTDGRTPNFTKQDEVLR